MDSSEGFTAALMFAALVTCVTGYLLCRLYLSIGVSLLISAFKTAVSFFFFSYFNFGQWYMKDDLQYVRLSIELKRHGYTAWNTLWGIENLEPLSVAIGSEHTLYYWWNLLAFALFGEHYYSAVFLNIILTYVCAVVLAKMLKECGFAERYFKLFLMFNLLHWDILSWSSFVNLKDPLVLTLTCTSYFFIFRILRKFSFLSLGGIALSFYLLLSIRHYVPLFILMAVGIWVLWSWRDRRKYFFLVVAIVALIFLKPWETKYMSYFQLKNPIYGALRFLLMPQFWTIDQPNEAFIEIPALLHWIFFIPMFIGAWSLWRRVQILRIPMIYLLILTSFYALVPELQGMRQRFQLAFIITLCQFHALWLFMKGGEFHKKLT